MSIMEQELLMVEKESIEQMKKERDKKVTDLGEEELKKNIETLSPPTPVKLEPTEEDIKITSMGDLVTVKDRELLSEKFSFMDNSDDLCKVTIKEESEDEVGSEELDKSDDSVDKSEDDSEERSEVPRYKFPTF